MCMSERERERDFIWLGKRVKNEVWGKHERRGRVVDWIWRLYNVAFESGVVPENLRSGVIVPLYKGKGERSK